MGKTVTVTKHYDDAGKLVKEVTETTGTTKKPLLAHILIDNSTSMKGWEKKVESGVNEYVATLKRQAEIDNIDIRVSVSMFASGSYSGSWVNILRVVRAPQAVSVFVPLAAHEIKPHGNTPLHDAVGDTVKILDSHAEENDIVLVILTDGGENCSGKFTSLDVKNLLKAREAQNWGIIYLGANQDAWAVGGSIGVSALNTSGYEMGAMSFALANAGLATARYASTRSLNAMAFTDSERASMTNDIKTTLDSKVKK